MTKNMCNRNYTDAANDKRINLVDVNSRQMYFKKYISYKKKIKMDKYHDLASLTI